MKHTDQFMFEFGPQPGEIWTVWSEIVIVVRIGSMRCGSFLPNCIEYIGIGYSKHDGCGRWWEVNYRAASENPDWFHAPTGTCSADRIYFLPWNGKGVFYGTKAGSAAAALISRYLMAKSYCKRRAIEQIIEKLFSRQIAPAGFM